MKNSTRIQQLTHDWETNPRWKNIERPYTAEEVIRLRGSIDISYTLAKLGAEKFYLALMQQPYVPALGTLTGNQAIQVVEAGLPAIYLSGWQVAADANLSAEMYPDQSLYASTSVPQVVKRINNALRRRDEIQSIQRVKEPIDYLVPIIADAEAGFGGNLNAFELCKQLIDAGAAAIHLEDQLSSAKKCGHLGGKVLVPTQEAINKLIAARLAADICHVPTVIIGRTDADSATLITSDIDPRDQPFIKDVPRTSEGFYAVNNGLQQGISRALSYAPYCDLLWLETSNPDLTYARDFAEAVHEKFPGKLLAYNCSPSFNWSKHLDDDALLSFREELASYGYKFQFITLAGFHALNTGMFELSKAYLARGMKGYADLQNREFELQKEGYNAVKHQAFVGASYFDEIQQAIQQNSATQAMTDSTETAQF